MARRRALSSVYGFIVIYMLLIAGLAAIAQVSGSELSLRQSVQRGEMLQSARQGEHLSLYPLASSLAVVNDGSVPSQLRYILVKTQTGLSVQPSSVSLPAGSSVQLPLPAHALAEGVVTSLGNEFWYRPANGTSIPSGCGGGTATLTVYPSPAGSGSTSPSGVQWYCIGQSVQVSAAPSYGYAFSSWLGTGNGSYTGTSNPATVLVGSQLTEEARFIPGISVLSLSPTVDGYAPGQTNTATVTVSGAPQPVTLSALNVPPQATVTFSPATFTDSLSGSHSTMSVSYSGQSYGTNYTLMVQAAGSDGASSSTAYRIVVTPPNGYSLMSTCCYSVLNQFTPRLHRAAYWQGTYFSFMIASSTLYYVSTSYAGGEWGTSQPIPVVGSCGGGIPYDVAQRGGQILIADLVPAYGIFFNFGTAAGRVIQWHFQTGLNCELGVGVATRYFAYTPGGQLPIVSVAEDAAGNVWIATDTYDQTGHFHLEILEMGLQAVSQICCSNVQQWNEAYVSQPYQYPVLPSLFTLANGDVAVVYSLDSSQCPGEYAVYTSDGGTTWSQPLGPETTTPSSSSPLCIASSSGTQIGDTVYFGGINSAGSLSFWSLDLDTLSFSASGAIASGPSFASITSVGSILAIFYQQSGSLYAIKSYDGGATWSSPTALPGYSGPFALPARSNTYQVQAVGVSPGGYLLIDLYTV